MLDLPELLAPKNREMGAMRMVPVSFHPLKFCIRNCFSIIIGKRWSVKTGQVCGIRFRCRLAVGYVALQCQRTVPVSIRHGREIVKALGWVFGAAHALLALLQRVSSELCKSG